MYTRGNHRSVRLISGLMLDEEKRRPRCFEAMGLWGKILRTLVNQGQTRYLLVFLPRLRKLVACGGRRPLLVVGRAFVLHCVLCWFLCGFLCGCCFAWCGYCFALCGFLCGSLCAWILPTTMATVVHVGVEEKYPNVSYSSDTLELRGERGEMGVESQCHKPKPTPQ